MVEGGEKWATVNEVNASHHALLNLAGDMDEENTRRKEAERELEAASEELRQSARLLEQEESLKSEQRLRSAEGEVIPVTVSGTLLHNLDGGINGTVLMLHDLRERKRAEQREQYAAFQSGVAEMSANILHNVGNTIQGMDHATNELNRVLGNLLKVRSLFQKFSAQLEGAEGEQQEQLREKMVEAGRRVPQVIDGMEAQWGSPLNTVQTGVGHIKEVIRMQQQGGEPNLHAVRFSVAQLLDDLRLLTENGIRRADIELSEEVDRSVPDVELPRNQLLQALINLVKNAIESIKERKLLEERPAEGWRIRLHVAVEQR